MSAQKDSAVDELLSTLLPGNKQADLNIIPDHITMLQGSKSKKQIKRKRRHTKNATLTRRQLNDLGLSNLCWKKMNYITDGLPLNKLWEGYIKEQLHLTEGSTLPQCYEGSYETFSKMLPKFDLHGAIVHVTHARCPSYLQLSGIVVMETRNTVRILALDNTMKLIPKQDVVFEINVFNVTFVIFGANICIRPAERSVKKIKMFPIFHV